MREDKTMSTTNMSKLLRVSKKGTKSVRKCKISAILLVFLVFTKILHNQNVEKNSSLLHVDAFVFHSSTKVPRFWIERSRKLIKKPGQMIQSSNSDDDDMDDETLLKTVTKTKLQELCKQYNVSVEGTKMELLQRLRSFAEEQARLDKEEKIRQQQRIEAGLKVNQGKAKYRLVNSENMDEDDDDDFEGVFFYQSPSINHKKDEKKSEELKVESESGHPITVPPPPPGDTISASSNGERVVTVYSSSDQNDLTGVDASASSMGGANHAMMGGYQQQGFGASNVPENTLAGGPFGDSSGSLRKKKNNSDVASARETVTDLVRNLLAMTGAPAFNDEISDEFNSLQNDIGDHSSTVKIEASHSDFVGFDPDRVPIDLLTKSSKALRIEDGAVLEEVLSEFELQAIGHDGISAPDDRSRGGGHYIEVQKVRAFLEGYRKAETKRIARETLTMLLDKLVLEGVKGLDEMLMMMTKDDSTSSEVGELNDSLIQHLNDAIRQQERKVELIQGSKTASKQQKHKQNGTENSKKVVSSLNNLWNTTTDETGNIIEETIDPNDERVKMLIQSELAANDRNLASVSKQQTVNPAEQLLILLCLLRDRLKAEAVFEANEQGKNLRVLAYCLHGQDHEIDQIVVDNLGSSLATLDTFSEFLTSSIDYAESTSHQLAPSKKNILNLPRLKMIQEKVDVIRERISWKASGISPQNSG